MKTFIFGLGFVLFDAIVPKSCSNAQPRYYDDEDSIFFEKDSLYIEDNGSMELDNDTLVMDTKVE